jgi:hypothetical protein
MKNYDPKEKPPKKRSLVKSVIFFIIISFTLVAVIILIKLNLATYGETYPPEASSIFDFSVESSISDGEISLQSFKGKKAYLLVNVASECGLTDKNYGGLQNLYQEYEYVLFFLFVLFLFYHDFK